MKDGENQAVPTIKKVQIVKTLLESSQFSIKESMSIPCLRAKSLAASNIA